MQRISAAVLPIIFLSILFVFPVFADEDDSVNQTSTPPITTGNNTGTTTNTSTSTNTSNATQTCAQGNCNACATQTIAACGNQNTYAGDCDFATKCKENPNGKYTCRSAQNPNGCSFDQYDCSACNSSITGAGIINSVITAPQPKSEPTDIDKLGNQCALDCGKCAKRYDSNLDTYTYDTCIDDKGQEETDNGMSFCKNGATKFRCTASLNKNCVSDSEGSYSYACSAQGAPENAKPKPVITVTSASMNINGSSATLGGNFAQNINLLPMADLTKEQNIPIKIDVTYSDGSTKSFFLTFKYKPKQTTIPVVTKPTEQPKPKEPNDNKPKEPVGVSFTDLEKSKDTSYDIGVLVLKYFPLTVDSKNIDIKVTGDVGEPYQMIRQRTIDATNIAKASIEKATTYLGYKDSTAQPALRYGIVDTKEYTQGVPFDPKTRRPLYAQIMQQHNICDYVNNKGVREVWIWAYQGPRVFPPLDPNDKNPDHRLPYLYIWESTMQPINKEWFVANGGYEEMPTCKHTYMVYTLNYQRDADMAVHSWSHQIEAELKLVDTYLFVNKFQGASYPGCDPDNPINIDGGNIEQRRLKCLQLRAMDYLGKPAESGIGRCGSVHNAPNARFEYDTANSTSVQSDCMDWNPNGRGTLNSINCETWGGCKDLGSDNSVNLRWYIWMWQNLPGRKNNKTYQGKPLRNWWDVYGDFDNVMKDNKSLTLPLPGAKL